MGEEWSKVGDAPWWYNERALVSLLAGAVWKCGGDAFEEFSNDKRRTKEISAGRIDLWFALGKREFNAEAKACWYYADNHDRTAHLVKRAMDRSKADAKSCIPDGRPRLAVVFGRLLVRAKKGIELEQKLKDAIEASQGSKFDHHAVAWCFPALEKPIASSDGYILPGIILWMRKVG
jgi:hypothetical protein